MNLFRKILEKELIDICKQNYSDKFRLIFHISFHLLDLINFFKFKKVNWKVCFDKNMKTTLMFDYWTPIWHKERGAYINISFFGLRFMRGY